MLEKNSILRRILCLWGWHHWTKYQHTYVDHTMKVLLPGGSFLVSAFVLSISLSPGKELSAIAIGLWLALLVLSFIIFPRGFHASSGPFDGSCIYCHKHVTNYTDSEIKSKDDAEYKAMLTETAQAAYDEQGLPRSEGKP